MFSLLEIGTSFSRYRPVTRQEVKECLLLGGLLAAALGLLRGSLLLLSLLLGDSSLLATTLGLLGSGFLGLLLSNRSLLAGALGLLSSLILLVVVVGLALGSLRGRLGRCLSGSGSGSGGLGRTTASLGRLSLSIGDLLSSSLTTRTSPLSPRVGLGGRLSGLLLSGVISDGLLGTRSSLRFGGLLFLLGAVFVGLLTSFLGGFLISKLVGLLVGLFVGLLNFGGLVVLGARSLLHLLGRLGIFVFVAGGAVLLGLIIGLLGGLGLGLLGLVISGLWACQYKTRKGLKDSWMTNSLLSSGLLLGNTEATHARAIALSVLILAVSGNER